VGRTRKVELRGCEYETQNVTDYFGCDAICGWMQYTRDEINSLKESGECRKAEQLIKEKYSGQEELYDLALLYSECDKDYNKV
jgi:hypothetical protein